MATTKQEQHPNVWAALIAARTNFQPVKLDKTNPHYKNRYASMASLYAATNAALAEAGLHPQMYPIGDAMALEIRHPASDTVAGPYLEPIAESNTSQQRGSAVTYARRYLYQTVMGIVGEDDDDGNEASQPRQQARNGQSVTPTQVVTAADDSIDRRVKLLPFCEGEWTSPNMHERAVQWALTTGAFSHQNHAQNSYKSLVRQMGWTAASPKDTTVDLWEAWVAKVYAKLSTEEQEIDEQ